MRKILIKRLISATRSFYFLNSITFHVLRHKNAVIMLRLTISLEKSSKKDDNTHKLTGVSKRVKEAKMKKYVAYYRVSTKEQGKSGLGIEAQKNIIQTHLNGGQWEIIESFEEVESGAKENRKRLNKAIELAKKEKATLIVAKLDRLSRDLEFTAKLLKDSDLKIKVAEMPSADNFTLSIHATIAQQEREMISKRTKQALNELKKKGKKLGANNPKIKEALGKSSDKSIYTRNKKANEYALKVKKLIKSLDDSMTQKEVVDYLNEINFKTQRGGKWHVTTLRRVIERF